jgi:hypothetical protein
MLTDNTAIAIRKWQKYVKWEIEEESKWITNGFLPSRKEPHWTKVRLHTVLVKKLNTAANE